MCSAVLVSLDTRCADDWSGQSQKIIQVVLRTVCKLVSTCGYADLIRWDDRPFDCASPAAVLLKPCRVIRHGAARSSEAVVKR